MEKVVVIAVHPDDETLGCGGTILKHLKNGDEVHCILITKGNKEQEMIWNQVKAFYNFTSTIELDFPELYLADTSLNKLIPAISSSFNKIQPSTLYIPNRSDMHSDHQAVFKAVSACTKVFRYPFIEKVLMCEVISETDFVLPTIENIFIPNYFVDISNEMEEKVEIMKLYESEMLPYPATRNESTMRALNRHRGSMIGTEYAEAFMSLKIIIR